MQRDSLIVAARERSRGGANVSPFCPVLDTFAPADTTTGGEQSSTTRAECRDVLMLAVESSKRVYEQETARVLFGLPAARRGALDPFNSFPIPVTPLLNSCVAYVRDTIIPALYVPPWVFRICRAERFNPAVVPNGHIMCLRLAEEDCRAGLDPEMLPLWISSRMLAILPHLPPNIVQRLKRFHLEAHGPSMQRVRRGIETSEVGCLDPGDVWFVACFFRRACFENDPLAVRVHAQALTDDIMSDRRRYTEVAIALTLCHCIKKGIFVCDVDGVDLTDVSQVVMPRVAKNLEIAMHAVTVDERVKYEKAWLWICFLGAHHEARIRLGIVRKTGMSTGWFQEKVMQLTVGMGWRDVRGVLDKFVYVPFLKPEQGSWFRYIQDQRPTLGSTDSMRGGD